VPDWIVRTYPHTEGKLVSQPVHALARLLTVFERLGYPAERVIPTIDGTPVLRVDGWDVIVTTYLGAPLQAWQPDHALERRADSSGERISSLALLAEIGSLLGRLHALEPDMWSMTITANGLNPAGEVAYGLECLAQLQGKVPLHREAEYHRLVAQLRQLPSFEGCPHTLIHGDCHLGNVVLADGREPVFVDWEAAGHGLAVTDLALLLSALAEPEEPELNGAALFAVTQGYVSKRQLSAPERALLPEAIRFRILVTLAGAFERPCSPDYDLAEQFWGVTYDDWSRQADCAERVAQQALRNMYLE
jgi:Ser/Thr protein kinase RdoA (MazF antagonist)